MAGRASSRRRRASRSESYEYLWGTERWRILLEKLESKDFSDGAAQVALIREECERLCRIIELRPVLREKLVGVVNACVVDGRYSSERAAALPLEDLDAFAAVIDPEHRGPGRPRLQGNEDRMQVPVLRAAISTILVQPQQSGERALRAVAWGSKKGTRKQVGVASRREKKPAGKSEAQHSGTSGAELGLAEVERANAVPAGGSSAVMGHVQGESEAETTFENSHQAHVSLVPESEILVPEATGIAAGLDADVEQLAEVIGKGNLERNADLVSEPEPEPAENAAVSTLIHEEILASLLGGSDYTPPATLSAQWMVALQSPRIEEERWAQIAQGTYPARYDPSFGGKWDLDPLSHQPELYHEFLYFDAAIDKSPEELTDSESREILGPVIFPKYDFDPKDYAGRRPPEYYSRTCPVAEERWVREMRRIGDSPQQCVKKMDFSINLGREEERARRRMWPLILYRRDLIKGLIDNVALGEMTLEPVSMAQRHLKQSVMWRVFREADHNWLVGHRELNLKIYLFRMLDKLAWPEGLSRRELLDRFGQGADPEGLEPMSPYAYPPLWMLPRNMVFGTREWRLLSIDRAPYEPGDISRGVTVRWFTGEAIGKAYEAAGTKALMPVPDASGTSFSRLLPDRADDEDEDRAALAADTGRRSCLAAIETPRSAAMS